MTSTEVYGDDEPIPLAKACQLFFRGALTKSSLRTEHRKGNLDIIQIANKDFVTHNGIKRMMEKCRKNGGLPASGYGQTPEHGSSKMEPTGSAQNALRLKLQQRKANSLNTSPANIGRSGEVVPLR